MNETGCDTLFTLVEDTCQAPEMLALPDTPDVAPLPADYRLKFFHEETLPHTEVATHQMGIPEKPLEGELWRNDWLTSLVLISLVTLCLVLRNSGKQLWNETKVFLYAPRGHNEMAVENLALGRLTIYFFVFLLSLTLSCAVVWFMEQTDSTNAALNHPYLLLSLYTLGGLLCIALRYHLYNFINWIFFDKAKSFTWRLSYSFLLSVEATLMFPAVFSSIYFSLSPQYVVWIVLSIIIFIKILLLFKAHQIFFQDFYGTFHLIVYLCTLETAPLLMITTILAWLTEILKVFI